MDLAAVDVFDAHLDSSNLTPGLERDIDAELVRLARGEGRMKLRLGELLDALFIRGGHHELGFSSIGAYVVERAQQSAAWGRQARGVARRLREGGLSRIRGAVVSGELSWSKAELLSRHATAETEVPLLERANESTVRGLKLQLEGVDPEQEEAAKASVTQTMVVNETEVAMVTASRMMVGHLVGREVGDETFVEALLAEAETSLQFLQHEGRGPRSVHAVDFEALETALAAMAPRRRRDVQLKEPALVRGPRRFEPVPAAPVPGTVRGIDAEVVRLSRALARRNLELGRLLRDFARARRWAGLGYSSLANYARERLGLSLSSVEHRLTLARAGDRHRVLGGALESGVIGYEAGLLVAQVLGRSGSEALAEAWVARARRRTIKHLREEVRAVMRAAALAPEVARMPPDAADIEAARSLEAKVLGGGLMRDFLGRAASEPQTSDTLAVPTSDAPGPQTSDTLAVPTGHAPEPQTSHALAVPIDLGPARAALRFRISRDLLQYGRRLEAEFRRWAPPTASFLGFLCTNLWQTWLPHLGAFDDRWKEVYRRDLHACQSPVCQRRDVTPHHLIFRAHGGSDDASNMVSLCSWCHLSGVHEGRLRASGMSDQITWRLGRQPWLEVRGRDRKA